MPDVECDQCHIASQRDGWGERKWECVCAYAHTIIVHWGSWTDLERRVGGVDGAFGSIWGGVCVAVRRRLVRWRENRACRLLSAVAEGGNVHTPNGIGSVIYVI